MGRKITIERIGENTHDYSAEINPTVTISTHHSHVKGKGDKRLVVLEGPYSITIGDKSYSLMIVSDDQRKVFNLLIRAEDNTYVDQIRLNTQTLQLIWDLDFSEITDIDELVRYIQNPISKWEA